MNIGIVNSVFYAEISQRMLAVAKEKALSLGITIEHVSSVLGAFDIPLIADALLAKNNIDGVVVLGSIIKGKTKHDEIISHAIANSILSISLLHKKPLALGITGPAMHERQAYARIRPVSEYAVASVLQSYNELKRFC